MNIHLPAILGFTRYQGFDPSPYIYIWFWTPKVTQKVLLHPPWGSRSLSVQLRCEVRPPSGPSPRWVRLPQGQRSSSRGLHEKQRWHVVNQGWFMTFWYYMLLSLSIIYGFIRSYTLYYKKKKNITGRGLQMLIFKQEKSGSNQQWELLKQNWGVQRHKWDNPHKLQDWVMEIKSKAMGQSKTEMRWTSKRCRQQKKTGLTQQFNQQRWAKTSNRCGLYNDDIIIITITIIVVMYIYIYTMLPGG